MLLLCTLANDWFLCQLLIAKYAALRCIINQRFFSLTGLESISQQYEQIDLYALLCILVSLFLLFFRWFIWQQGSVQECVGGYVDLYLR